MKMTDILGQSLSLGDSVVFYRLPMLADSSYLDVGVVIEVRPHVVKVEFATTNQLHQVWLNANHCLRVSHPVQDITGDGYDYFGVPIENGNWVAFSDVSSRSLAIGQVVMVNTSLGRVITISSIRSMSDNFPRQPYSMCSGHCCVITNEAALAYYILKNYPSDR